MNQGLDCCWLTLWLAHSLTLNFLSHFLLPSHILFFLHSSFPSSFCLFDLFLGQDLTVSPDWLRTLSIDQTSLKLTDIAFLCISSARFKGVHHYAWLASFSINSRTTCLKMAFPILG